MAEGLDREEEGARVVADGAEREADGPRAPREGAAEGRTVPLPRDDPAEGIDGEPPPRPLPPPPLAPAPELPPLFPPAKTNCGSNARTHESNTAPIRQRVLWGICRLLIDPCVPRQLVSDLRTMAFQC